MQTRIKATVVDNITYYESQYMSSSGWVSLVIGDKTETTDIDKAKQAIDNYRKNTIGKKVEFINYP